MVCAHSNGPPCSVFVKANSDNQSHKNAHSSGSPTCGHSSCTEPRSCTGTKLESVSNDTRYKRNRTSSNGNEPIVAADTEPPMQTGQIRVDQNSACSVSATDDEDDGTTVDDDDDDDWTTTRSKKNKKKD